MSLANEDRGVIVGAFIVVEGDEILSITSGGQVVRSPIDEQFRATGRSTMGVRFVTPKNGDSVAVVARSVEKDADGRGGRRGSGRGGAAQEASGNVQTASGDADAGESDDAGDSATIGPEDADADDTASEEG